MTKRFCDICREPTEGNWKNNTIRGATAAGISVEIMLGFDGLSGTGDFCKKCFIKAVDEVIEESIKERNE